MAAVNFRTEDKTEDKRMTTQANPQRKSKRDGVASELSCFFTVKPGRAPYIREALKEADVNPLRLATFQRVGTLTEARLVLFDNETRLGFFTVFEGEWDRYIEDFVPGVIPAMDKVFRDNVEGWFKDPLAGSNDGTGEFTIPQQPIRRRVKGLPQFVVTRGGEYFFMPGLRALRWLADIKT
jgi:hypothetical protein